MAKPFLRPTKLEITEVFPCTLKVACLLAWGMASHLDFCLKEAYSGFKQPAP